MILIAMAVTFALLVAVGLILRKRKRVPRQSRYFSVNLIPPADSTPPDDICP